MAKKAKIKGQKNGLEVYICYIIIKLTKLGPKKRKLQAISI